jgi:hypothetical protein
MKDTTTITESVDAAIAYLASKGALGKLSTPCPVLYRDVVMWRAEEEEEESYELPPLTVDRI